MKKVKHHILSWISQGFPEKQNQKEFREDRERERERLIYYKGLPHMIMEAKSHSLPSASGRPRKVSCVRQSACEGLRIREADSINPSVRGGED